jgi:hypothetical protein
MIKIIFEMTQTDSPTVGEKSVFNPKSLDDKHLLMSYFKQRMFVKLGTNENENEIAKQNL